MLNDKLKNIAVYSHNLDVLVDALDSTMKKMYRIFDIETSSHPVDLLIIDTDDGFQKLEEYKRLGLIKPTTPCLFVRGHLSSTSELKLDFMDHAGLVSIYRNTFGQYAGISNIIKNILEAQMPTKSSQFLFVIPIYNEEDRLDHVLDFLNVLLDIIKDQSLDARIKFVNDGSEDQTDILLTQVIERIREKLGHVQIDHFLELETLKVNTKKSGIYKSALRSDKANYYCFIDGDNSFYTEDIVKAISIIKDGYYDIVQATKDNTATKRSMVRKIMSFFKRGLTGFLLPQGISDSQTGFRIVTETFARNSIPFINERYGFAADLQLLNICKALNFRALQLPVKCIDQEGSHVELIADSKRFIKSIVQIGLNKEVYHEYK